MNLGALCLLYVGTLLQMNGIQMSIGHSTRANLHLPGIHDVWLVLVVKNELISLIFFK
jgi:hypothetical protein